jgi:hypothetical protein
VIEACASDADPAVRILAVHVMGDQPEHFRETWKRTLALAASDSDDGVAILAEIVVRHWEKRWLPWEERPVTDPPPGRLEETTVEMRGMGLPTPVDVVLRGDDRTAIAEDGSLLAFERWFAARAPR